MVEETLLYSQYSELIPSKEIVLLEPELTHKPLYLQAELSDPALIINAFSQIYSVNMIKTGRTVISNPIGTIQ